jgi:hypothetical protein
VFSLNYPEQSDYLKNEMGGVGMYWFRLSGTTKEDDKGGMYSAILVLAVQFSF